MSSCNAICGDWYDIDKPELKAGHKDCPKPVRKPCKMQAKKLLSNWAQLTFTTPKGERLIVSVPWSTFSNLQAEGCRAVEAGAKVVRIADGKKKRKRK